VRATIMNRRRSGFTLVESLIALGLLAVVGTALTSLVLSTQRDYVEQRERVQAEETIRSVEALLTRVLRTARVDPRRMNIGRLDADPDNSGVFDDVRVRSDFNPVDGDVLDPLEDVQIRVLNDTLQVRWQALGSFQPVAAPVRSLRFFYHATDGTALATPATAAAAKRIRIVITVPGIDDPTLLRRRETWVYLRN
jgi:prepilin-type N-terminal cleavage/methylation domain-containing protein